MSTAIAGLGEPLPSAAAAVRPSGRRASLRRVLRQRSAIVGLALLGFLFLVGLTADVVAPYNPNEQLFAEPGAKPRVGVCIHALGCAADRPEHYFGLDGNARDELSRVLFGVRVSLAVGFVVVGWSILVGTLIGAVAGYIGGWLDNLLMRFMDLLLAFPALLLTIVIVTILGKGLNNALLAVGFVSLPIYARVMRASVLSVREQDFVTAARALGDSRWNILLRRVIPNAVTPIIVQGTLGIGTAVLEVAALSFIGLAAQAPNAELGSMISLERDHIFTAPHLIIFPGLAITLIVLGFNLLGDGLRDAFDPRLSR